MASQSFNVIDQEEEELVDFGIRQSRVATRQYRPNSRMEEMLSQLIKSQDATAKSIVENASALEAKVSELAKSQSELHTSTDDKLSHIAYKHIEHIAEMSDLVDRISTVERSFQDSPFTGSDRTRRSPTPPRHALMASAPFFFDHPLVTYPGEVQNGQIVRSTTANSYPFTQELTLTDETNFNFI